MKKKKKRTTMLYRTVSNQGHIYLPKIIQGQEVKVIFERDLTEEEEKQIEISKLYAQLKELRRKRRKK